MSINSPAQVALRGFSYACLACCLQVAFSSPAMGLNPDADEARMATYDSGGETHFALSVSPHMADTSEQFSDVVIYVDTSASQTGAYQADSLELVQQLLNCLNAEDRVKIVAMDLAPVTLTAGFVNPGSPEITVAVENLSQRVPMGATDIELMLTDAANAFESESSRNRNVIYVGDGISRAGILLTEAFAAATNRLFDNRVSISSFAIGPERDFDRLAMLANHTGGNFFVDTDEGNSVLAAAAGLSQTVHGSVFWPQSHALSQNVIHVYPERTLPLRSDRDTILLGTLADRQSVSISINGIVNGQSQTMEWKTRPEASSVDFAFLPALMRDVRKDDGATMATVGSAGLRSYSQMLTAQSTRLTELGNHALSHGNVKAAKKLASEALLQDPVNTSASKLVEQTVNVSEYVSYPIQEDPFGGPEGAPEGGQDPSPDDSPFGLEEIDQPATDDVFGGAPAENPTPDTEPFGGPAQPTAQQPMDTPESMPEVVVPEDVAPVPVPEQLPVIPGQEQPGQAIVLPPTTVDNNPSKMTLIGPEARDEGARLLMVEEQQRGRSMVANEEERRQIVNERARKQVQFELKRAREESITDPASAIERTKDMLEVINQTPDLFPSTLSDLRYSLESALLTLRQKKLHVDEARQIQTRNTAISQSIEVQRIRMDRREQKISELVNRFKSLLAEQNYKSAVDVSRTVYEIAPSDPHVVVVAENARVAYAVDQINELRRQKQVGFFESLYQAELASVAFPGDPIMVFPDAEEWKRKRLRRKKYEQIRLTGSENDEKILNALEEPASLAYDEAPWSEVEEELERKYKINIVLDQSAINDDLDPDTAVTANLTGIRFKNALKLMLKNNNATFIVRNEVLLIISLDDAASTEYFVTNVYNVGDLVAPRQHPSPIPFAQSAQGGGAGSQQGGGGQGGFGGGGGQQGGGGGGVFCVQESSVFKLGTAPHEPVAQPAVSQPKTVSNQPRQPRVINLPAHTDWNSYFEKTFATPADVRETVRHLMNQQNAREVVSLVQAAIQNDQMQPWMHEAMVLTMQIAEMPKSEIERALMSAVDLSEDPNDAMYAAQYMAVNGMEQRAIRILKDFAIAHPTRTEPYLIGLRAAQKINDLEGIKWATVGIFSQEWPEHPEVVQKARYASDAIRLSLKKQGLVDQLATYEKELTQAFERDCVIDVSWTGDADIDLYVVEPGGTVCSRLQKRTTGGGISMGDNYSAQPGASGAMSEQYVLPKGFAGDYKLVVRRVWGEVTSGKVTVSIKNHFRSEREASETRQVELDEVGALVLFELDNGRRTEPLEEHAIRTVVRQQMAINRLVLAQQIGGYGSSAEPNVPGGGLLPQDEGFNDLFRRRGAVGYQPVIEQFFTGGFMTVNHATTADRLYVLTSISPNFSQISSVSTFNILGNADTASGVVDGATGP